METITLLAALLNLSEKRQFEVAHDDLQISPSSLSRHAQGLLRKPSVLRRAAEYFSELLQGDAIVDADLLLVPIRGEHLVMLARKLRADTLKSGTR
jgi:hypothetical protein